MEKLFSWGNIHKGVFTSTAGLLIIVASAVSVFSHGRSWTEAAAGIVVGMTLLGIKDPTLPTGGGTGGALGVVGLLVLGALAFGGCVSTKKVLEKYGTQNAPTTVAVTDSLRLPITISTKADSLAFRLPLDSLATATVGDTLHLVSTGGLATVTIWKSAVRVPGTSQVLNARVKVPPQVIHDTVTKVVTLYGKCPPTYTLAPKPKVSRLARYWGYYQTFCTAMLSVLLIVLAIVLGFRFKPWRLLPFLGV